LPDGTHTDWTPPQILPTFNSTAADTYLLPAVDPVGVVYTTVVNFPSKQQRVFAKIGIDYSTDGGKTWQGPLGVTPNILFSPLIYANTTFRSGILNTFAVGTQKSAQGRYPLYVAYEDYSAGVANIILTASYDGGTTWSAPIQVNDNDSGVDEFQPNLTVAPNGTVSVAFYDRRLACPAKGTAEALAAGLALDNKNPNFPDPFSPYDLKNYCVNASVQFYAPDLTPKGHNLRLTQNTFDPQLNAPQPSRAANLGYTFIGDYFGTIANATTNYFSFVSTVNDGTNPNYRQQQVVASIPLP
jgi:hypothetical protein